MDAKKLTATFIATALMNAFSIQTSPADERGQPAAPAKYARIGHSKHGEAFDEGPRQRPWKMDGIGKTRFPITTPVPEVQEWFDQGHTLLHSYWVYEAERAFRWCLKLDPECAMAYWGLYRCTTEDEKRAAAFLREASKRKDKVSERERMYIEAWEARTSVHTPVWSSPEDSERQEAYLRKLEGIMLKYPDDVEAKALYANDTIFAFPEQYGKSPARYGNELVLQEILAKQPDHPGAHHYRIHNWDGPDAARALDSFVAYQRVAPSAGHAQHMPGHGYGAVGMWHEAAIAMDGATRVEQQYMRQRMTFPFDTWNYAHNLNYLCFFREQLGMVDAAVDGARQLLAAPLDPKYNNPGGPGEVFDLGLATLIRALVHFEQWENLLEPGTIPFRDKVSTHQFWKAYTQALAHVEMGNLTEVESQLAELRKARKDKNKQDASKEDSAQSAAGYDLEFPFVIPEIEGLLALARGDHLEGLRLLTDAAEQELERRERDNDPPTYPRVLYNVVGETYLKLKTPRLAVQAFEKALKTVPNDGIALSGLTQAHFALGEEEKATKYYARLLHVWSDADPGLRWMEAAKVLGLTAEPRDDSPAPQRNYRGTSLAHLGPANWEPYGAPKLEALDAERKLVGLDEYHGKNLVLIFYLGEECPHCMKQLVAIKDRINDFQLNNTEVAAISSTAPEDLASEKMASLSIRLLSDTDHANAKRFHSYDDFEELELHSTILIDGRGKVRWARSGGDPFMDLDFLVGEIKRVNGLDSAIAKAQ